MKLAYLPLACLLFFLNVSLFAQNKAINYQAVIVDPNPIQVPGADLAGQPLAKANICLKFSFVNSKGVVEYTETQKTVTDDFGLINLMIGSGNSGLSSSSVGIFPTFGQLKWDENPKTLVVYISLDQCITYTLVNSQPLLYTPYALYADAVEFKNVRDSPTKVSYFTNDLGYLIPKDLEIIKQNITQNSLLIDQNQKENIANDKVINQTLTILGTKLDDHADQLDEMGTQVDTWGTKILDHEGRLDQQSNRINTNQSIVLGQIGEVNAKISNMKLSVDLIDQSTEKLSSKSNAIDLGSSNPSSQLYPTQRATKSYVDNSILAAVGSGVPDATTLATGKLQLAGDLSGTATHPIIPALLTKEDLGNKSINIQNDAQSYSKYPSVKAVKDYVDQATMGIALQANVDAKADKNSPTFTGIPVLPTGATGVTQSVTDNSTKLATTAFVQLATTGIAFQATVDEKADKNSPTFTGIPVLPTGTTGVTQSVTDNSTKLATTAFVNQATSGIASQAMVDTKADKNSPTFTGIPVLPTGTTGVTQAVGNNSSALATTGFVYQATSGIVSQATVDTKADKNSPTFTGIPVLPTGTMGVTQFIADSSSKLATTAFIKQAAANVFSQININSKADKNSPTFTGIPVLPTGTIGVTQTVGNNSSALATTGFVYQATSGIVSQATVDTKADKNSPTFTGIPVLPTGTIGVTQTPTDSSTKLATTAFIKQITSVVASQANMNAKADMISPVFLGTPYLPTGTIAVTQDVGNNSTAIATTAFVLANSNASGYQSITAGTEISNSSPTDIPVNGMTIRAVAGKYIVSFNSQYTLEAANITGQASVDLTKAYIFLMTKPATIFGHGVLYGAAGAGEVLGPGIYSNAAAVTTAGILTLDGGGNPNAEFIFNFGAAFSTGASFELVLKNGASACNVYWVVEGAIALGANTSMKGFFISNNGAIALGSNSSVDGSLFSKLGAIDILSSTVTRSIGCVNNFGALNNFAIYSKVGAISNTGNSKITGNIGYDGLNASLVTGFDSAIVYGEIFTAGISSAIANFSLYQNGTLIPFSSRKRVSKYPLGEINLQAIATVGSGENIDVRWNVDTGIVKLQNRVLTILSVRD